MKTHQANENGQPIDDNGEVITLNATTLFNGANVLEFDSQDEFDNYIASLPKVWNKESHLAEINALHEDEFKRRLFNADYVGEWELNAVLADSENEYFDEAVLIINYWWNGWDAIKAYSETVTEENFIDPIQFVNDL
jgi:hypothetical protein